MSEANVLAPLPDDLRDNFNWRTAPYLQQVTAALEVAEPGSARFVGGCVRDSLMGVAPKDVDIATRLTPEAATAALKAADLRVAPTGVEHGTVTAIVDHKGVEVTSLRADVSTDGRRATVAFTRDWATDAQRRDFTVNAIYLTPDGFLYDPVSGIADARQRRVRFIGAPEARIREDFLRILRFFRFSARFCDAYDENGLAACAQLRGGMTRLSAERIGAEMTGILSLPRAAFALEAMQETGVLAEIWDTAPEIQVASRMKLLDPGASAPLMLAALYGEAGEGIGRRLRLSNAEKAERASALNSASAIRSQMSDHDIGTALYRRGKDGFYDGVLLAAARGVIDHAAFDRLKVLINDTEPPVFATSGKHVVAAGVAPGPAVSEILATVEAQWIAEDFPDEARQKAILKSAIARRAG